VTDPTEKDLDPNVMIGQIAARNTRGGKWRGSADSRVGFGGGHERIFSLQTIDEELFWREKFLAV
jgi:hypothetical protein